MNDMTGKIKAALADAIRDAINATPESATEVEATEAAAAAVVALVSPKPLVWSEHYAAKSNGFKYDIYGTRHGFNCVCYPYEKAHFRICEGVGFAAAQAAAQSHADAAHWSNTVLGDMIGGE